MALLSMFQHPFYFLNGRKPQFAFFVGVAVVFVDLICSFAVQRLELGEACSEVP